ncbi:MAG: hypothetical protein AB1640_16050 [bacterium]
MDPEIGKHLRALRLLVTLALLAAFISFGFSYVLFRDVSVPLERLRNQEYRELRTKVDSLVASREQAMSTRLALELKLALLNLEQISMHSSGDLQVQAQKALTEIRALLGMMQKPQGQAQPQAEKPESGEPEVQDPQMEPQTEPEANPEQSPPEADETTHEEPAEAEHGEGEGSSI